MIWNFQLFIVTLPPIEQGCWFNVLVGSDDHLYFIDTIIYPSDTGGYDTYRSLSPRFSK